MKIVLDPQLSRSNAKITADAVEIDVDPASLTEVVGEAMATVIRDAIREAGWVKTGKLADGVQAVKNADGTVNVVIPGDRLVRDEALADKLAAAAPAVAKAYTPAVRRELEKAFGGLFTVTRRAR